MDDEKHTAEKPLETSEHSTDQIPGGEQQTIPKEPEITKVSEEESMGCVSAKPEQSPNEDERKNKGANLKQTKIDEYVQPKNNIQQNPKKQKVIDISSDRSSPHGSPEAMSDEDEHTASSRSHSGPTTRSKGDLARLKFYTFCDSDDENSGGSSWAKRDIEEYRNNYPYARSDSRIKDNYQFYMNQIRSHPDGDYIDEIHSKWFGKYDKLEYHHGYIQWLFPLQEKGLNWSAEPLQGHEIEKIKAEPKAMKRILESYRLMLDFYGFELMDPETGEIRRSEEKKCLGRFDNLNRSSHNYLRITRILKCLGEFDYEYLKFPFLKAILREAILKKTLSNCLRSCQDYWIETLRSSDERRLIRKYARDLIKSQVEDKKPPPSPKVERSRTTKNTSHRPSSTKSQD